MNTSGTKVFRNIRYSLSTSEIVTKTYNGREYIVCPVVSQVANSIVKPMDENGDPAGVEFIPASVLAIYPEHRNGHPIVMNHPFDGQIYCDADSSPEIMEKFCFGFGMNFRFEDDKIKGDLWLDPVQAEIVGPEAVDTIERIKTGKLVEVSEGNFVIVDNQPGMYDGKHYDFSWIIAINDHIAVLSDGMRGACGYNEHGCGAATYMVHSKQGSDNQLPVGESVDESLIEVPIEPPISSVPFIAKPKGGQLFMTIREFLRKTFSQIRREMFATELSSLLIEAVEKVEPGFTWLEDYDEANGQVVYCVMVSYGYGGGYEYQYFQRSFTVNDSKMVTLGEASPVSVVTRYEPRVESSSQTESTITTTTTQLSTTSSSVQPCSCNKHQQQQISELLLSTVSSDNDTVNPTPVEEESMDKPKNREEWLALAPEDVDVSLINESLTAIQAERVELEQSLEGVVAPAEVKTLSTQSLRALASKLVKKEDNTQVTQSAPVNNSASVVADYSAARSLQTGTPNESRPNAWGLRN